MAWSAPSERWDPDHLLLCPYDASHRIKASRFQRHILRCRLNFPNKDFVSCPFNASHQILRPHLRNHICSCPDKDVVEPSLNGCYKDEHTYHLKGDTSVPSYYSNLQDENDEDWDEEITGDNHQTLPSAISCQGSLLAVPQGYEVVPSVTLARPVQHRSMLPQTREELKRQMKQKALSDGYRPYSKMTSVDHRWYTNACNISSGSSEQAQHQDNLNPCSDPHTEYEDNFVDGQEQSLGNELHNDNPFGYQVDSAKNMVQRQSAMTCRQEDTNKGSFHSLSFAGRGRGRLIQSVYENFFEKPHTNNGLK